MPTSEKLIKAPAGPPSCSALPELTSRPGPIMPDNTLVNTNYGQQRTNSPPIAIICRCLDLSCRFNGADIGSVAISSSDRFISDRKPFVVPSWTGPLYVMALTSVLSVILINSAYKERKDIELKRRDKAFLFLYASTPGHAPMSRNVVIRHGSGVMDDLVGRFRRGNLQLEYGDLSVRKEVYSSKVATTQLV